MANSEKVDPLRSGVPIVGDDRGPTIEFIRQWNALRNLANFLFGSVEETGVTAGDYGQSGVVIPSFTVDAQGRLTTAADVAVDLDALLDAIGATRGAILYRGASGWAILPPGTSGHVLKSNGAGADPSYQAESGGGGGGGWTFDQNISTTGVSSVQIDVSAYDEVELVIKQLSTSSSGRGQIFLANGSLVRNGATDYALFFYNDAAQNTDLTTSPPLIGKLNDTGDQHGIFNFRHLLEAQVTVYDGVTSTGESASGYVPTERRGWCVYEEAHDAIIISATAGTFDAMDIDVYGR